jgi:hypothetical protein
MKLQVMGRRHRVTFRKDNKVFSRTYTKGMVFEGTAETLRNFPDLMKQVDDKIQVDVPPINGEGVPEVSAFKDSLPPDLNSMTVDQLKAYAEENEIDMGDSVKKADIIAAIQLVRI